jgi:flagellar hook protein FlgE
MASTSGIAQSGLQAAALAVNVSANNVANALTEDFVPSRVVTADVQGGGVTADVERLDDPVRPPEDPLAEVRADRALLVPNRVDLAQELVNQARAAAVYKANLETLRTDQELQDALVKMVGSR